MPQDHSPSLRKFAVFHKTDTNKHCIITDRVNAVSNFMWGRNLSDYQLYVNGREYDWPKTADCDEIEKHVAYCERIDEGFYE